MRCHDYLAHQSQHRLRPDGWRCEACDPQPDTGPPCPGCRRPMAMTATLGWRCPDAVVSRTHPPR